MEWGSGEAKAKQKRGASDHRGNQGMVLCTSKRETKSGWSLRSGGKVESDELRKGKEKEKEGKGRKGKERKKERKGRKKGKTEGRKEGIERKKDIKSPFSKQNRTRL